MANHPGLDAYVVLNSLSNWFVVPPTYTLTMTSGVTLKFASANFGLMVEGYLQTVGTPTEPVIFTSLADSAPGEWEGITVEGGSVHLSNAIVRHGEEAMIVGTLDADDSVHIEDSVLQSSLRAPLGIKANTLHQLNLDNVTFTNNQDGNYVVIYENGALVNNVILTKQPGLEGYVLLNSPSSQLVIPQDISLTLMEGVTLKFNGSNQELVVAGHLQTMGTMAAPVVFTSLADSAPNQWSGIVVENGSIDLDYADVRYGEYNILVNNTAVSNTVLLENSAIHDGSSIGLWVLDGTVTAVCSAFSNNGSTGVYVSDAGNPSLNISSSAIVGNVDTGLLNSSTAQIDARNNWWGEASGPGGIGPGSGDAVQGNVLYDPWLNEETCTTLPYRLYLPSVITP